MTQLSAPEGLATAARPAPPETRPRPAGDTDPTSETSPASDAPPIGQIGAGILGPDPMPPITDEERKRRSDGLLEVTTEYQAEHGAFTEEERARVRTKLTSLG